jgi:hypothetical protein
MMTCIFVDKKHFLYVVYSMTNIKRHFLTGAITFMCVTTLCVWSTIDTPRYASAAEPDTKNTTNLIDQSTDITFGERISIKALVDTGAADIDTVRAFFKPRGGATVWSYSYPDVSSSNGHIYVDFEIHTGPGSYYPPGTEFDLKLELSQRDGAPVIEHSLDPIEYLDPAHEWQRTAGDGYTVVFYGQSKSDVDNLVDQVNLRIPMLQAVLGVTNMPDCKAVVFPSIQEATPSFPSISQTATEHLFFAGFAQPEYRLFVQGQMNQMTFVHELVHLYTHEAVSSSLRAGLPAWLSEGLARYLESGSSEPSKKLLLSIAQPDDLLQIRHMWSIPGRRADVAVFYPQAGAFVGYLVEQYGAELMAVYLSALNGGGIPLESFKHTYKKNLFEIENDWRALFHANALPIPSATSPSSLPVNNSSPSTPVPLVDFSAGQNSYNTAIHTLESIFPQNNTSTLYRDKASYDTRVNPDYRVIVVVAVLSGLVAIWLFTPRYKLPKRKP